MNDHDVSLDVVSKAMSDKWRCFSVDSVGVSMMIYSLFAKSMSRHTLFTVVSSITLTVKAKCWEATL